MKKTTMATLKCADCGAKLQVQKRWADRQPEDHVWRCKNCRVKHQKLWFKNMSPERQQACHEQMSRSAAARWKSMTPEEYKEMCSRMSAGDRKYWDELTNEEYVRRCEAAQGMWNSLTPEQRLQHSINISKMQVERWKNMSAIEYFKRCQQLSEAARKFWENISDSELAARRMATSIRFRNYWSNMSLEEYQEWKRKQSEGFNEYLENLGLIPNKNEMQLIEVLKKHNIPWDYQYSSMMVDPEFEKRFPSNPILGVKRVNPYHKWDFKINLVSFSILVDIDGSIHDPSKTSYEVTYYNGKKFQLSDYITFKDAQRPYQRDNMRAFVIKCYDDVLNDDCKVVDLTDGNTMLFKDFIIKSEIAFKTESLRNGLCIMGS